MDTDVLVIGGGAAGLAAAAALREQHPDISVTLVNPTPFNVYRPWLMYALPHLVPPEDLRISLSEMADRYGFTFRPAAVDKLDATSRSVLADGELLRYQKVIIAAGAPTDRAVVPGADRYAVFPCDLSGFVEFQQRLDTTDEGTVTIVLTGERISPGLEDGAWLARTGSAHGRKGLRVRLVADGDCFLDQFGAGTTGRIRERLQAWGAELVLGTRVAAIGPEAVELADGRTLPSTITALVGALRGPDVQAAGLTDDRGFFPVDRHLRSVHDPHVFVAGDAVAIGPARLRKNWQLSVRQARVAATNAARGLGDRPLVRFNDAPDRRKSAFSLPDVGGTAYLVWNRRLVTSGPAARRIRAGFDRKHFAAYLPVDERWRRLPG